MFLKKHTFSIKFVFFHGTNQQQSFDACKIMEEATNNCGAMWQTGRLCDDGQL